MQLVETLDGQTQYDITVEEANGTQAVYRTSELLSQSSEDATFGKATRVWKAVRLCDGIPIGEPVALKDAWTHEELNREGTSLEVIRGSDNCEAGQKLLESY